MLRGSASGDGDCFVPEYLVVCFSRLSILFLFLLLAIVPKLQKSKS